MLVADMVMSMKTDCMVAYVPVFSLQMRVISRVKLGTRAETEDAETVAGARFKPR